MVNTKKMVKWRWAIDRMTAVYDGTRPEPSFMLEMGPRPNSTRLRELELQREEMKSLYELLGRALKDLAEADKPPIPTIE